MYVYVIIMFQVALIKSSDANKILASWNVKGEFLLEGYLD